MLPMLPVWGWTLLVVSGLIVGLSKAALPGANTIAVAVFATVLPAKASTGALLLLLIVGDVFALWAYRKHADWPTILRLFPTVVVGVLLGVVFLAVSSDGGVRRVIGVILLLLVGISLWRRFGTPKADVGKLTRLSYGALAGFTTMVANAGGPVMSMYFLAAKFPVRAFLGTAAWFFALVNLGKVPFSLGLGLITPATLLLSLVLVPAVVAGGFVGRGIVKHIPQRAFEWIVLLLSTLGALYLVIVP
ncbi:sulfite exporter TauE/SafE family protein [Leucobacter insecticola]|uniref:Probable membrane transporter protein n=2 Tax=Leucobacter insecticola TaxID=2714934 RepID=A0A6G8FLX8_9MICO|nr:sulfite exporter TauE/SafE family protein [Leucobacter insecticola]QIM17351.1 sulfite exporter TauE/SafE family protein [Leucobacter insecticola]